MSVKYIQVIDRADNCYYPVYSVPETEYLELFPNGQDIEFNDELFDRLGSERANSILIPAWKNEIDDKSKIEGLHGTIFYQLEFKKSYYPTKKEDEMQNCPTFLRPYSSDQDQLGMLFTQIVTSVENDVYGLYALTPAEHALIFLDGCNVEFDDDLKTRLGVDRCSKLLDDIYSRRMRKPKIRGIHGTLFVDFSAKKKFYPTKIEAEMVTGF